MGTRKHISVNLRDLQRVMNEEEDDPPNFSSEKPNKFGAAKTFEYKLSSNRWENEDNDDDFELPGMERKSASEVDFTNIRQIAKPNVEAKPTTSYTPPNESVTVDDNWRSKELPKVNESPDCWRSLGPTESTKTISDDFRNMFNRGKPNKDYEFTREKRDISPLKNDRFSCFDEPRDHQSPIRGSSYRDYDGFSKFDYDRRNARTPPKADRPRDDWDFPEKTRNDRTNDDDRNRKSTFVTESPPSEDKTGNEGQKKGLFVPSYRRSAKKEETVEDIFMKAAGITPETEKQKKEVSETEKAKKEIQDNQILQSKRNEVAKHNKLFKCSPETVTLIEEYVLSLLDSEENEEFPEYCESESLVPSLVTCVIVAKNCENCKTLEDVRHKFERVKKWLLYTTQDQDTKRLLTELVKSTHHWGYPSLSESVYLVEGVFDSLYLLGIVTRDEFLQWFENDVDEIPDRVTLLIQLMNWKRWLAGEGLDQLPVEESESGSESEDDSDIEANVPKPIRLTKGVKFK
uniref:W2 domain-containing protein n=1 Tax=Theileria annulata TaxID=5874 RepID=A0A3B0MU84_THEAN